MTTSSSCCFPALSSGIQGLDIAITALADIVKQIPNAELHLYGGGAGGARAQLSELADRLQLGGKVKFMGHVGLEDIAGVIANASDVGVVPKRADFLRERGL